jgi:hypothetical protein
MSYSQSAAAAKSHGQALLKSTIGAHPVTTAVVMAVLVVVILVLAFYVVKYRAQIKKGDGFHIAPISNLTTGNNNPEWQLGSMDAGNWGPVHRAATSWNVAAYHPSWRAGRYRQVSASGGKEGLAANNSASAAACAPGESAVTYQNPDGSVVTYCRSTDSLPGPATVCHRGWDPAASAEAEALATVGSLQHDSYGEGKLQRAINAAYDANTGLSDAQLEGLMHNSDLA